MVHKALEPLGVPDSKIEAISLGAAFYLVTTTRRGHVAKIDGELSGASRIASCRLGLVLLRIQTHLP